MTEWAGRFAGGGKAPIVGTGLKVAPNGPDQRPTINGMMYCAAITEVGRRFMCNPYPLARPRTALSRPASERTWPQARAEAMFVKV